jgi:lipopolysaccharide export system permease protein
LVILRYFSREILTTATAVSVVLLLVVLSGRFIQFLEKAANGELSVELMLTMIVWRVPSSLELILPLALTLSVLLVMSRLNQDSELAVLRAAGYSNWRLFTMVLIPALGLAVLVGWLSLVLSPEVARELDRQVDARERLTVFDTVVPGRFQTGKSGRLIYAESISADRQSLVDVFIVEPSTDARTDVFLTGKTARQEFTEGDKFLVLFDGYKHVGRPDQLDWEISRFDRYLIRLLPDATERPSSLDTLSTEALIRAGGPQEFAIASWRVSLPIMCVLMLPFAFVLGRGSPRQSRFLWVIPVIVFQFFYITGLSFAQKAVMRGEIPPWPGVFVVHLVVLALVIVVLMIGPWIKRRGWV